MHIGTLGRLVELPCASSLDEGYAEPHSLSQTVAGRVMAQRRPVSRRSWSASLSGPPTPSQVSTLLGFARGYWGIGPWIFVSDEAAVTNVLTPETSGLQNVFGAGLGSEGGPWEVEQGKWLPNSHLLSGGGVLAFESKTPVIPGKPVTASAYVQGTGSAVRIVFFDATDTAISTHTSTVTGTAASVTRSHITVTPPAGTVFARVSVNVATTKTGGPALTWTSDLLEYSDGNGCSKAIILDAQKSLVSALSNPRYGRYSRARFTVQEVG